MSDDVDGLRPHCRAQDLQALHRRGVPRVRSPALLRRGGLGGRFPRERGPGSRKDVRDAVVAARKAQSRWAGATAYNRGQVLYRVAEMLDGRRAQFAEEVASSEGTAREQAAASVDAAVDRWVWYAGWADKVAQVRRVLQSGRRARSSTSACPSQPALWA